MTKIDTQLAGSNRLDRAAYQFVRFVVVTRETGELRIEQLGGMFLGLPAPGPRDRTR